VSPEPAAPEGERVVLRDGSAVLVRPVRSDDAALIADGFRRLSPRSRRLRFLMVKNELSPAELRYFAEVDHHDHEALGAVDAGNGRGVGVARFVRSGDEPEAADLAVAVVDDWHRRGLGSVLLARLIERARQVGIRHFTAEVAADNVAVIKLLRRMDADVELVASDDGTLEYDIALRRWCA
jgi:ribosomal protein S18 acetylase RimI-like enzyme